MSEKDENNYNIMGYKVSRKLVPWLVGFIIILTLFSYLIISPKQEKAEDKRAEAITNAEKNSIAGSDEEARRFLKSEEDKANIDSAAKRKKEEDALASAAAAMSNGGNSITSKDAVDGGKLQAMEKARNEALANSSGSDSSASSGSGIFDESGSGIDASTFVPGSGIQKEAQRQKDAQQEVGATSPELQAMIDNNKRVQAETENRRKQNQIQIDSLNSRPQQQQQGKPIDANSSDDDWKSARAVKALDSSRVIYPTRVPTKYVLLEGTIIPIVLEGDINSDLPGRITVRVINDIYDSIYGTNLLVPKGTIAVGEYRSDVKDGQDRLMITFNRLMLKDGRSVRIPAMDGADAMGRSGISGDVNNHFWRQFAPAFLIAGVAHLFTPKVAITNNNNGVGGGTMMDATGRILTDTATKILNRYNNNGKPTITIDRGEIMNIVVTSDIAIPPDTDFAWDVNGEIPKSLRKASF